MESDIAAVQIMPSFNTLTYLPYLTLVEMVLSLLLMLTATVLMGYLAILSISCCGMGHQQVSVRASPTMLLFLTTHAFLGTAPLLYCLYVIVAWRPTASPYNSYSLFWSGLLATGYYVSTPLPVLFLTLDRCLVLANVFPQSFYKRLARITAGVGAVTILVVAVSCVAVTVLGELPLASAASHCTIFTCLLHGAGKWVVFYVRNAIELVNLTLALLFLYLVRVKRAARTARSIKTCLVKIALLSELLLSIIPSMATQLISMLTGVPITAYMGPVLTLMTYMGLFYAAISYFWILYLRRKADSRGAKCVAATNTAHLHNWNLTVAAAVYVPGIHDQPFHM